MKKFMLVFCLSALFTTFAHSQVLKQGDLNIGAGIGLLSTYAADGAKMTVPPLSLNLAYRVADNFSLGAYAAYSNSEVSRQLASDGVENHIINDSYILGLRAAAHTSGFEKWDLYGGFLLGYNTADVSQSAFDGDDEKSEQPQPSYSRPNGDRFSFSGFVGSAYFPGERLGIFGEVGFGISILNVGVQYKL